MCGDFGFYASEIIHAIRGLKEQGTFDTIVDLVGAFGPVIISGIALWISWRSSKNTEAIQKQIATAEERAHQRVVLLDAYSSICDFRVKYYVDEGLYKLPSVASNICFDLDNKLLEKTNNKNRVRLLLMGDNSDEAKQLLKAIDNAIDFYVKLTTQIKVYVANGDCQRKYNNAMLTIRSKNFDLTEEDVLKNPLLRQEFMQLTGDALIDQYVREFVESINDDNLDIHFKKYMNSKLS